MYKVAAEREAGLFEQLITPLLKQRRPEARKEAVEMLEDLAELADDLRAAMVRSAPARVPRSGLTPVRFRCPPAPGHR